MQPNDTKTLDALTRFSEIVHREIGVCVCENGEATMAFGDARSGQISCPACAPDLLFHTHPEGLAIPSRTDVTSLIAVEGNMKPVNYCVGALENGESKIKCFRFTKQNGKNTFEFDIP